MQIPFLRVTGLALLSFVLALQTFAQQALQVDLKKPEKFENKKLGYEKTEEKKFKLPRRFIQNTTTHYNYYFNANNKLNEAIARVKASHRDDYSQLLPFYNFSLKETAGEKNELDSVIYKATVGILIHDLRSNWVDNMYMLMGQAYYYRNELDSAYLTFQYINYAFSPKEKDGYDKVIGSNSNEGGSAFSISTKENKNFAHKIFTRPPSRNEAFLWLIKTYLAKDELPEAAGMIQTLKNDPLFPERLYPELAALQSHWFYKQNAYDSAAVYLEKALPITQNNSERARWEYLIAQLYERASQPALAVEFYERAIKHTFDPVMEVYARLNAIRQSQSGPKENIQQNINELLKMARKDRYQSYRDIIYYTAAQMELERKNIEGARALLLKSTQYALENQEQRNKSFLQLADLSFQQKDYIAARSYYDSVTVTDQDATAFNQRKEMLGLLAVPTSIIFRQDSLQRVAGMPDKDREALVRKLVRQVRKSQGLKEEEPSYNQNIPGNNNNQPQAADLFTNAPKGEWYFNNQSLKAKGFTEFRTKWGNRPNVDNWRRLASINQFAQTKSVTDNKQGQSLTPGSNNTIQEISYDALTANLPLTEEKLKLSNDSIESALNELGRIYVQKLEDRAMTIETYEKLLARFPNSPFKEEALFNLYYAYWKLGDQAKADAYKIQLQQLYPNGKYMNALNPGADRSTDNLLKAEATRNYEKIYTSFIEGNFEQAIRDKRKADSLYGDRFWTAQLLYIEAIYHIRQRSDEVAKSLLAQIASRFPTSPLREKAENLMNVLSRRAQIEKELTDLQVQRADEEKKDVVINNNQPAVVNNNPPQNTQQQNPPQKPVDQQVVTKPPVTTQQPVKDKTTQPVTTPAVKAPVADQPRSTYSFAADQPQLVMVVLDKVDPVYVTEARNAFNRYNREKYYNKTIEITNVPLTDDVKLVMMNNFENAAAAIEYVEKARKVAGSEIVPWLPPGKYTFYIISVQNLEVLKTTKDVAAYVKELAAAFPGKF